MYHCVYSLIVESMQSFLSACDVELNSWKETQVIYPQATDFIIHEETQV